MHHDLGGLLNAPDLAEGDGITKSGGETVLLSEMTEVSAGDPRHGEKNQDGTQHDGDDEYEGGDGERDVNSHATTVCEIESGTAQTGDVKIGGGLCGASHLHADESGDGDENEEGEGSEEERVDGKDGGREYGEKCEHREVNVIALTVNGEHFYDDDEEYEVNGGGDEIVVGDESVISGVEDDVSDREERCPALGNADLAVARYEVAAEQKSNRDEHHGKRIELAGGDKGEEGGDQEEVERDLEEALNVFWYGTLAGQRIGNGRCHPEHPGS